MPQEEYMSIDSTAIAIRAAHEGIPIASIGRIVQQPFGLVHQALSEAQAVGKISSMPKADWPPSVAWDARQPVSQAEAENLEFLVRKGFRLTKLEAGFMAALLRYEFVDKARLHSVIEQQRMGRAFMPATYEPTDQKMVDVIICHLRKKLELADPRFSRKDTVKTMVGSGYHILRDVKKTIKEYISGSADRGDTEGPESSDGDESEA